MDFGRQTTRDDFKRSFELAANVISKTRKAVNQLNYSDLTTRNRVARALLTASLDHSSSLMHLFGTLNPVHVIPAMALFRSQLDTFSRGVFFASADACSEKEITTFLEKDKLPRRAQLNGGKRTITLDQLFDVVRSEMIKLPGMSSLDDQMDIEKMLRYGKDQLHAPVHGGSAIVAFYRETEEGLYFCPPFDLILPVVRESASFAVFAHVFIMWHVCGLPEPSTDSESEAARAAFYCDNERYRR